MAEVCDDYGIDWITLGEFLGPDHLDLPRNWLAPEGPPSLPPAKSPATPEPPPSPRNSNRIQKTKVPVRERPAYFLPAQLQNLSDIFDEMIDAEFQHLPLGHTDLPAAPSTTASPKSSSPKSRHRLATKPIISSNRL